ncbi:MAG: complex I subunit 5 family protein [Armatimonadota bacterium]
MIVPIAILLAGSVVVYGVGRLTHNRAVTGFAAIVAIVAAGTILYMNAPDLIADTEPLRDPGAAAELMETPAGEMWETGRMIGFSDTIVREAITIREVGADLLARFELNGLGFFLSIVAMGLALIVALFSVGYMHKDRIGKYYALLLMMTAGMVGIGLATDLFNMFVMFELMSIASFALVAFETEMWEPVEAGVKYLIMSAIGSMIALLGIVLIFVHSGTLSISQLQHAGFAAGHPDLSLAIAALFIGGFGVKSAIVPMHTWLPDAHSAAPSGISAMLSGIVISAGLITMTKALTALNGLHLGLLLALFAVITMFVGNFLAWVQSDLKRMLAYSSIAHMGYILVGVGVAFAAPEVAAFAGMRGGLFHILTHAIMKGGAFLCAGAILTLLGTREMNRMGGVGARNPLLGIAFAIFVLGLAGTPPMNGFISKLYLCKGALVIGEWGLVLAAVVIINSVISLFYYLPALNKILFGASDEADQEPPYSVMPTSMTVAIFILAILTLVIGIVPEFGLNIVDPAAEFLRAALY